MSRQSFIDAIDSLSIHATGKLTSNVNLPMNLFFESETSYDLSDTRPNYIREFEICAKFGSKMFIDESNMDHQDIAEIVSRAKTSMKRVAFADALDFAQRVAVVAAKNGNQELMKMAFDFQDRILKTP
jgi:hypothetical protein